MSLRPQAFARARAMFAAAMVLQLAHQAGNAEAVAKAQANLSEMGPYEIYRKKGGGTWLGRSSHCVAMDKREARKSRNRRKSK